MPGTSPLGVSSLTQLLGIDAFVTPVMTAFGPVYQAISAVTLKPLSDFATSQYGPFINGSASQLLDLSKTLSEQSANLPGAPAQSAADTNAAATQTGAHRAENGGTLVSTLLARDTGVEQVQSTADTDRPASTDTPDAGSGTTAPVTPAPAPAPAPVIETPTQTTDPTPPAETPTTPAAEAPIG